MSETATDRDVHGRTRPDRLPPQNGGAIRALREKDGETQNQFAKRIKMNQSNLSRIESEAIHARLSTLNKIARGLCVPVGAIMRDTAEEDAA
jgi:transcriptional regulator with XRE-family HTH domain